MKKINWKIRIQNPVWCAQIVAAIFLPILAYFGLTVKDMITWQVLGTTLVRAISNPYVVGLVVINAWSAINDPTNTNVISDSKQALTYKKPKKEKK